MASSFSFLSSYGKFAIYCLDTINLIIFKIDTNLGITNKQSNILTFLLINLIKLIYINHFIKFFIDDTSASISLADAEFFAENQIIGIVPNFSYEKISLISGSFGPFKAQIPVNVPLWLALEFKKKGKWVISSPAWLDIGILKNLIEVEKGSDEYSNDLKWKLPDFYFFELAILLLHYASEQISDSTVLRTLIEDLFEIRKKKLLNNMKAVTFKDRKIKKIDNITFFEINMIRGVYQKAYEVGYSISKLEETRYYLKTYNSDIVKRKMKKEKDIHLRMEMKKCMTTTNFNIHSQITIYFMWSSISYLWI